MSHTRRKSLLALLFGVAASVIPHAAAQEPVSMKVPAPELINPEVPHPRWSQATEQRLGESGRRATLPFNGYADQVAHLYSGMDLRINY
jgi:hypothetical protein